jgi:DNA processing protein
VSARTDAWLAVCHAALGATVKARRGWQAALAAFGSVEALAAATPGGLAPYDVSAAAAARLQVRDAETLEAWRTWLAGPCRALVGYGDERYPELLTHCPDPPLALWIEGRAELLAAPQLAIVGSRNPTRGGKETAEQFARFLSARGLTITSGLATGIDAASHRGALQAAGSTIAVLGTGIDIVYPRAHEALAVEIRARGLVVSEYPPGITGRKANFPERNRIIAGLAAGTLVVEATMQSGSLSTARAATDAGREVFAIPGSIHNPLARGCHKLIREGAKLVQDAADILEELGPLLSLTPEQIAAAKETPEEATPIDDPAYANVLEALAYEPTPFATLLGYCRLTAAELSSMLLVLELEGFVEALPGGRYARLAKRD